MSEKRSKRKSKVSVHSQDNDSGSKCQKKSKEMSEREDENTERHSRSRSGSSQQRFPQQTNVSRETQFSEGNVNVLNSNDNRSGARNVVIGNQSKDWHSKSLKAKRNLIEELGAIDAEFGESSGKISANEIMAPDGIRITVNREEDEEFVEGKDFEIDEEENTETVFPIDSDAETVVGEADLNDSYSSSTLISFHPKVKNSNCVQISNTTASKKVQDMTLEELVEANLALKLWMEQMNKKLAKTAPPVLKTNESKSKNAKQGNTRCNSDSCNVVTENNKQQTQTEFGKETRREK